MARPNVLMIAKNEFQSSLNTEGEFLLFDGRPISLDNLMRKVNARRLERGEEQVLVNPNWEVRHGTN